MSPPWIELPTEPVLIPAHTSSIVRTRGGVRTGAGLHMTCCPRFDKRNKACYAAARAGHVEVFYGPPKSRSDWLRIDRAGDASAASARAGRPLRDCRAMRPVAPGARRPRRLLRCDATPPRL